MRSKQKSVLFKIILISLLAALICVSAQVTQAPPESPFGKIDYPVTKADLKSFDDFNGTKLANPWKALEDPKSPQTTDWIKALNNISMKLLCDHPKWQKINQTLSSMWNYKKYSAVEVHGENPKTYYTYIISGLQNHDVLYRHTTPEEDPTDVFFDINAVDPSGDTSINKKNFSPNGKWFACGMSKSGSDWMIIKVIDTATKKEGPDCVKECRNSPIAWLMDSSGFLYARYVGANLDPKSTAELSNQTVWYHKVGTTQDKDIMVLACPEHPNWRLWPDVSYDGQYLFVALIDGAGGFNGNGMAYAKLDGKPPTGPLNLTTFISNFTYEYYYTNSVGTCVYLKTNHNAPNNRVIKVDITKPEESNWQHFIQEDPEGVLEWAQLVNNNLYVCHYIKNVKSALMIFGADGKMICNVQLDIGQIVDSNGYFNSPVFYYKIQSFVTPGFIYELDLTNPSATPKRIRSIQINLPGFDPSQYKTDQVEYKSKDGTLVPMYITKNASLTGPMPCLLFGEGSDQSAVLPFYNSPNTLYMRYFQGAFVVPGLRGGNEKGAKWWKDGYLEHKQNTFDDMIWAADYVISINLTTHRMLAIYGSGLTVLVACNQAPNKFFAAIADSPLTDMHRYQKFGLGKEWVAQFGSSNDPTFYKIHDGYSPLDNCFTPNATHQYPNLLVSTGELSDRIPPLHVYKFLAELFNRTRNNPKQTNGCLGRIYTNGFTGSSTKDMVLTCTDMLLFLHLTVAPNAIIV